MEFVILQKPSLSQFTLIISNNIKREEVIDEFEKHHKSGKNDKIKGTPEVLINGYILPKYYNINDLVHFADMFNI